MFAYQFIANFSARLEPIRTSAGREVLHQLKYMILNVYLDESGTHADYPIRRDGRLCGHGGAMEAYRGGLG
jgi:hypothetical protein